MAQNLSSSGTSRTAPTDKKRGSVLPPPHGSGMVAGTRSPDELQLGPEASEEIVTSPSGRGEQVAVRFPLWLHYLQHYILALLFVAAAALARREMGSALRPTPFLVFYLAWVGAAAFGGLGPGLLATVASWLCVDLFFDPTPWHIDFSDPEAIARLAVLMAGGLAVSLVGEKMRRARLAERRQGRQLAQLAQVLDRERRILQSVMDGAKNSHLVFLDRQFNFVRVNEAYAETCGYTPEEMIGKNHFVLYAHADNEAIFARVRDTGAPFEVHDKPFVFPDQPERGTTYWDWTLTPIKNDSGYVEGLVFSLFETTQRKRAEEELRELNATLESKVAERTEELEHRAWQLQKLTLELAAAEERERERVAQILHDDLQQILAAAKFRLGLVGSRTRDPERTQETVKQVDRMLKDAIEKSRSLSHELSPGVLRQGDLVETFEWLAEQMQAQHGLTVRVEARGAVPTRSDAAKALLYRSAQEMLFNVVKHAQIREARLRIRRWGRYICLSVSDRGRGFDPREIKKTAGFGLWSIRERVALLGGRMKTKSAAGRGTTCHIIMPDAEPSANAGPTGQEPNGRATPDDPL